MAILKYLGIGGTLLPLCAVRYSDDDCTPDSDDECGDEDRRI